MTGFYRVFAFVLVLVVLGAGLIALFGRSLRQSNSDDAAPDESLSDPIVVTMDEFLRIENGMSYQKVVEVIGAEGNLFTELSQDAPAAATKSTKIYSWTNPDSSKATVTFEDDRAVSKDQFSLK